MQTTTFIVVLFAMVGIATVFAMFVRQRSRDGIKPLELTEKDKAQWQEIRQDFSPRRITGQLLGSLGMLFIMACLYSSGSADVTWKTIIFMVVTGVGLVFAGALLLRTPRPRAPYWRAAVWGMICSGCFLSLAVCVVFIVRTPREHIPRWLTTITFLLIVTATLAAIACIVNGLGAFIRRKSNKNSEDQAIQS